MAHFTYTRVAGIWNTIPVSYAELANLDAKTFAAINGDAGGTWAPSSVITIGGSGVTVTGPLISDGTFLATSGATIENGLTVTGLTDLQNDLDVAGIATLNGEVALNADVAWNGSGIFRINDAGASAFVVDPFTTFGNTVNFQQAVSFFVGSGGYSFTAAGKTQFDDLATFTSNAYVQLNLQVGGDATVDGALTADHASLVGALAVGGTTTLSGRLAWAGTGRPAARVFIGPDSNANISITDGNTIIPQTSTDRTYTWLDAGSQDTDWMELGAGSVVGTITLNMPAGTTPGTTFQISSLTGQYGIVKFARSGGIWRRVGMAVNG
jgi:hypothetical protein